MFIPKHLQIETINGVCSSRCIMCTFEKWTRKKHRMSNDIYMRVLNNFLIYKDKIEYLTLQGCGEPLLDIELPEKVKIAKDMGFRGTGFATNCTHLTEEMALKLLDARLDTIICSIDGVCKETHESIRIGVNFDAAIRNVQQFIELRDSLSKNTRVLVRFVRQEKNVNEVDAFKVYWNERLNSKYGDGILIFDVHNWGEKLDNYTQLDFERFIEKHSLKCEDVYNRMCIYSNGDVGLCCVDYNGFYNMGNVIHEDPIEIYNNKIFTRFRNKMEQGKILELEECRQCTIPHSRFMKSQAFLSDAEK